ncbi:MAG TPA: DegT/DnrJ/EryC1/StrS family aminotransferase [Acidobacteriota bacterium]|nr:DegT/DnrJ/EryC1/StrS family aminotransferase [Acidobacteriota bacterium]
MPVPIVNLARQHEPLTAELQAAVGRVFAHSGFILGREVADFEAAVARECGVTDAIGVASGSDALLLALHALGIGPGDEVIVPTFTFFSTASAVSRLGATPVFCDICTDTYNIDPVDTAARITARTRAILVVHLYGQMADMTAIMDLAYTHGLPVIEDAAQAIGASLAGAPAGSCGDAGCISFFPTKNLGAAGDGGMVVTSDPVLADMVQLLRGHGARPKYFNRIVGYNSRLDALQAAILGVKLPHAAEWSRRRRANADVYDRELAGVGDLVIPARTPDAYHIFHQYTLATGKRDALLGHLRQAGIGTEVYYPQTLHLQECYSYLHGKRGDCPVAERAAGQVLSIPVFAEMTEDEQAEVIDAIKAFFR